MAAAASHATLMKVANPFQSDPAAAAGRWTDRHIVQSPKHDSVCSARLDSAADTLKGIVHKPHKIPRFKRCQSF